LQIEFEHSRQILARRVLSEVKRKNHDFEGD
jgi:hypothetical protein